MLTTVPTHSLLLLLASASQVLSWPYFLPKFGGCPDVNAQQDFITNIDRFLKTWYVQSSVDTEFLHKGRCVTATYRFNHINNKAFVITQQFNDEIKQWERQDVDAYPEDAAKNEAKFALKVTVPILGELKGTYAVLGTDYDNYSVIHGCGSFLKIFHYDCSWLMSRKQNLTAEEEKTFYDNTTRIMSQYDFLVPEKFKKVDQTNCEK